MTRTSKYLNPESAPRGRLRSLFSGIWCSHADGAKGTAQCTERRRNEDERGGFHHEGNEP